MSDRRPENPKLLKQHPTMMGGQTGVHSFLPAIVEATPEDVIDFVRRGVESGTIKGEEQWLCREDDRVHDWAEGSPPHCWFLGEGKHNPECGPHVVISLNREDADG